MCAYEKALTAISKEVAPCCASRRPQAFYALLLGRLFVRSFKSLGLIYPRVDAEQEKKLQKIRKLLEKND